jgi:hypothetical protein
MEQLVRPYQTQEVSPAIQTIDPGFTESNAPVWLRLGVNGQGKTYSKSTSSSTTVYVIKKPKEKNSADGGGDLPGSSAFSPSGFDF